MYITHRSIVLCRKITGARKFYRDLNLHLYLVVMIIVKVYDTWL